MIPSETMCATRYDAAGGAVAGVPLGRAVQVVHAEVASRVRSMIIDACAAKRAENTAEEMSHLLGCDPRPAAAHAPLRRPPVAALKQHAHTACVSCSCMQRSGSHGVGGRFVTRAASHGARLRVCGHAMPAA